jgi:hypothetical protein
MDEVQEEQAAGKQLPVGLVKVYLDIAVFLALLDLLLAIDIADGLQDVADIRTPTHQDANWSLG